MMTQLLISQRNVLRFGKSTAGMVDFITFDANIQILGVKEIMEFSKSRP